MNPNLFYSEKRFSSKAIDCRRICSLNQSNYLKSSTKCVIKEIRFIYDFSVCLFFFSTGILTSGYTNKSDDIFNLNRYDLRRKMKFELIYISSFFRYLFAIELRYLFSCFRFISEGKHGHNKKTGQPNASLRVVRMRLCHLESYQTHHGHSALSATYVHTDTRVRVKVRVSAAISLCSSSQSPSPSPTLHLHSHPHPHPHLHPHTLTRTPSP